MGGGREDVFQFWSDGVAEELKHDFDAGFWEGLPGPSVAALAHFKICRYQSAVYPSRSSACNWTKTEHIKASLRSARLDPSGAGQRLVENGVMSGVKPKALDNAG